MLGLIGELVAPVFNSKLNNYVCPNIKSLSIYSHYLYRSVYYSEEHEGNTRIRMCCHCAQELISAGLVRTSTSSHSCISHIHSVSFAFLFACDLILAEYTIICRDEETV